MKKYTAFILLLLIAGIGSFSQDVLQVKAFPAGASIFDIAPGAVLGKGWRWQQGDNAEWALPGFNDSLWQPINPLLDVHHSLPQIPVSSIFWLRMRFSADSVLRQEQWALLVQQSGASEIYLDGKLVKRLGHLDADADKIKAYDPIFRPILLPADHLHTHVLAIRYALEKNVHYTTAFTATTNPLFVAKLQGAAFAVDNFQHSGMLINGYNFFVVGLFFLLALIHSGYYFLGKAQKANLYFVWYALCYIIYVLCPVLIDTHPVLLKYYSLSAALLSIIAIGPLLLTAMYALLDTKKDWVYASILLLSAISVFVYFWQYEWGWRIGSDLMSLLVQIAIIRLVLKAVYHKKKGARLLAVGAVFFLLSFGLFVLSAFLFPENQLLVNLLFVVGVLSIPLATSLYLGLEFGFLSLSLRQKLAEVNELSQKNIAHEKEKQQLLARQNETLEEQVAERTLALTKSLEELKTTQAQLVQSEKMASLGELTAGIAHEIQNPLNFVNNFSEVNLELLEELRSRQSNLTDEAGAELSRELLNDIADNSEKINHHGKRAAAIVKAMLQHSGQNSGKKEPTGINALADEYFRLAYHGFRARDKSFNATLNTAYDTGIGNIHIVPQDIGRVLLNLMTNAFYAVDERRRAEGAGYQPTVTVSTHSIDLPEGARKIEIKVADNGNGISPGLLDKIFQPFFTTRPTGQGTGLGLSLAYDIVKAHGGELTVASIAGQGASFTVVLPVHK